MFKSKGLYLLIFFAALLAPASAQALPIVVGGDPPIMLASGSATVDWTQTAGTGSGGTGTAVVLGGLPGAWDTIPTTSWIGRVAGDSSSAPGPMTVEFATWFDIAAGAANITLDLSVLADDMVEVFLNGTSIGTHTGFSNPAGSFSAPLDDTLFNIGGVGGSNDLMFVVQNSGTSATPFGLDFKANLQADVAAVDGAPTPEPASLALMGLGLLGMAGAGKLKKRRLREQG